VRINRLDVDVATGMQARTVRDVFGVEYAGIIQKATVKG
jgi:hypothetical protein